MFPELVDFEQPEILGKNTNTSISSSNLATNKEQGDWAEDLVTV